MQLAAIALCKEVLFDKFSNTFSFIHVLERVRPAQYPFVLSGISLGMILELDRPVRSLAIAIACNQAGQAAAIIANFNIANIEPGPQKIHARLNDMIIAAPGKYECSVFCNDGNGQRLLATLPVYAEA